MSPPRSILRWCTATALAVLAVLVLPIAASDLFLVGWGAFCTVSVLRTVRRPRADRVRRTGVWTLAGTGLALTVLGDGTWFWLDHVVASNAFPSVGDLFYLAAYPFIGASLVALTRRELVGRDPGDAIDAGIVVAGASALGLVLIVDPFVEAGGSLLQVAVGLAYPLLDLLVLGLLLRLVFAGREASRWPVRLLAVGGTGVLVADVGFLLSDVRSGPILAGALDAGWPLWFGLVAAAAHADSEIAAVRRPLGRSSVANDSRMPPSRLVLLAVASLMAPCTLVAQSVGGGDTRAASLGVVSIAAFGLVLVRMAGLVRDVQVQAQVMSRLSEIDPLTELANRRVWDPELESAVAAARACGRPIAVAVLDIDEFKAFNDTFGHSAGDLLLVQAAMAWTANLREGDLLVRIGGEEFGLLLRDVGLTDATEITDRLRRACPPVVTCSAGVAALEGDESAADLVERADRALFAAKREGRDRTVAHGNFGAPVG